jgi:hypothetical protein
MCGSWPEGQVLHAVTRCEGCFQAAHTVVTRIMQFILGWLPAVAR